MKPIVPKEALAWFKAKKLEPSFSYQDVWREEHAKAFTVAKAMTLDVLSTFQESLIKAQANGETFHQFHKELKPLLQKLGWWGVKEMTDPQTKDKKEVQLGSPRRLRTIYRVNMRTSRAAGQWQRIQRTKATHPYLLYSLGPSKEHRLEHESWAGKIIPVDDPWWLTHYPPNGWGCKCRVRQVNRREAERRGGPVKAPKITTEEWTNKRTGEVTQVPKGIDPGWDYHPGIAQKRWDQLTDKLESVPESFAQKAIELAVKSPAYEYWLTNPKVDIPVGRIPEELIIPLNTDKTVVKLSRDAIAENQKPSRELSLSAYRALPELIRQGRIIKLDDHYEIFYEHQGQLLKAVLVISESGQPEVQRYEAVTEREMRRALRLGFQVYNEGDL